MRTSNPALIKLVNVDTHQAEAAGTMTIRGTVIATGVLLAICAVSAIMAWGVVTTPENAAMIFPVGIGSLIAGLILGLIVTFAPRSAPFLGPVYAAAQGVFLACFSYIITARFIGTADTGVIFQAVVATFSVMAGLLIACSAGLVRIGATAAKVMIVLASGLVVYFLVFLVGNLLLGLSVPNLWASTTPLGIGFTAACVVLASLFLVLDFQFVQAGVENKAPRHMEWYAAVGLLATLVWLYIELLRLVAKLRGGD